MTDNKIFNEINGIFGWIEKKKEIKSKEQGISEPEK